MAAYQDFFGMFLIWQSVLSCERHRPLSDVVHILGEDIMHVSKITGQKGLRFGILLFFIQRNDGWGSADVSGNRVQNLHRVLQLKLFIQSHNARFGAAVPDQDLP